MSNRHEHKQRLEKASESTILTLSAAGDRDAFTNLVTRHQQRVRRFMHRLCSDVNMAEDLAQQVFLALWQRLGQLQDKAAFYGWLRQIMVNLWKEELRRRKLPLLFDDELAEVEARLISEHHDASHDLDAALARLSPACRLCVMLSYSEGLSHAETSALTGFPVGTVKSHIERGSRKLRILLAAYAESRKVS